MRAILDEHCILGNVRKERRSSPSAFESRLGLLTKSTRKTGNEPSKLVATDDIRDARNATTSWDSDGQPALRNQNSDGQASTFVGLRLNELHFILLRCTESGYRV
jgi:hypothetical protein